MKISRETLRDWAFLLILAGLFQLAALGFVRACPFVEHEGAKHLVMSLRILHLWQDGHQLEVLSIPGFYPSPKLGYPYPPLAYLVTLPFYLLAGPSLEAALASFFPFLLILLFSVYGTGKWLWNRQTGLLAALICLSSPMILLVTRDYLGEFPLAASVALAMYALVKSEGFTRWRESILFGFALGMGMMIKWTAWVFFLGPVLWILAGLFMGAVRRRAELSSRNLPEGKSESKESRIATAGISEKFINLGWAVLLAALLATPWYLANWSTIIQHLVQSSPPTPPMSLFGGIFAYFLAFKSCFFFWPGFLCLIIGLILSVVGSSARVRNGLLLSSILVTIVIFGLLENRSPRFAMPLIPMLSVLAAFWITRRRLLMVPITVLFLVLTLLASFGWILLPRGDTAPNWMATSLQKDIPQPRPAWLLNPAWPYSDPPWFPLLGPEIGEEFPDLTPILIDLSRESNQPRATVGVMRWTNSDIFSESVLNVIAERERISLQFREPSPGAILSIEPDFLIILAPTGWKTQSSTRLSAVQSLPARMLKHYPLGIRFEILTFQVLAGPDDGQ